MGNKRIHPYSIIIVSFVAVVFIGTILLALPYAGDVEIHNVKDFFNHVVDSLFMATSAVCVTGLGVKNCADFTIFGKIVMAVLMEIGGLSFITIAVFFFTILGARIGVSNTFLLREALNQNSANGMVTLVKKIVVISFVIQIICAAINFAPLYQIYDHDIQKAIGVSLFHSAASFNNAGFDIFNSQSSGGSMVDFAGYSWENIVLNSTTIVMIVLGGIGFIVIDEFLRKRRWKRFSLHTKMVLVTTFILITIGTLFIKGTAYHDMNWFQALFSSVTCRTAGFTTYDMGKLSEHPATYVVVILLMMIGASPCSTGGGVKTTTIALIIITIYYYARGKKPKAFNRSINEGALFKAFVLVAVAIGIVLIATFIVAGINPELGLEKILFEVVSAFSTTGLSMGITSQLALGSKVVLCIVMLLGRLGPLTVIGVVNKNWMANYNEPIRYPEENVIIG
ncbi:MAG: hypothetical protein K6E20_07195 [Acholeplasmatales bacterium]|nr:hypothetical protein [Acholeplasmatales bacterium]